MIFTLDQKGKQMKSKTLEINVIKITKEAVKTIEDRQIRNLIGKSEIIEAIPCEDALRLSTAAERELHDYSRWVMRGISKICPNSWDSWVSGGYTDEKIKRFSCFWNERQTVGNNGKRPLWFVIPQGVNRQECENEIQNKIAELEKKHSREIKNIFKRIAKGN